MARSLLNFTRSVVNSMIGREDQDEGFDRDFLSQTHQDSESNSDVVSMVSYTASEVGLPPLEREIKKLARLNRLLGTIPEDDEDREEVQLAIRLTQVRKSKLEKEKQRQISTQPLPQQFSGNALRQTCNENPATTSTDPRRSQPSTQPSQEESPCYNESELQRRLRRLDDTLRGKRPRKTGPPLLGEILDTSEAEQLRG